MNIEEMNRAKRDYANSQKYGAHFLPYSWLYNSLTYKIVAIIIPIASFILALVHMVMLIPVIMIVSDVIMLVVFIGIRKK